MTNTQQITVNHDEHWRRGPVMHSWTEQTQVVIRARIRELELEAARERLAATARTTTTPRRLRRSVGLLLILAGRRIAGESVPTDSPAARPASPMAA